MTRPSPSLLQNKWTYIAAGAAVALWFGFGYSSGKDESNRSEVVNVSVAKSLRQDVPIRIPLVGTVVALESVVVKSRIDSQVIKVLFKDGDYVQEGQPLFELDDRAIKAQLSELQASVAKEKAQLVNLQRQYERAQKLLKTNVVSQAQVDEAKASYEAQLAQVEAAQATLDNAAVSLTYTTIHAPIGGRTGTINVTRGNNVKANDTQGLVTINRIDPIRVQFAIPQRYYPQVKAAMSTQAGLEIHARHAEAEESVSGKMEYIENAIDISNGTFTARANFSNNKEALWPGMFVNIMLDLGVEKNVLTVPAVAVQGDEGHRFVYKVEGAPTKALRTEVETALTTENTTIISKGLNENDLVVTDGILRLIDGATVHFNDDSKAPEAKTSEAKTDSAP